MSEEPIRNSTLRMPLKQQGGYHARFDCRMGLSVDSIIAACLDTGTTDCNDDSNSMLEHIQRTIRGIIGVEAFCITIEECIVSGGMKAKKAIFALDSTTAKLDIANFQSDKDLPMATALANSAMSELRGALDRVYAKDHTPSEDVTLLWIKFLSTFLALDYLGISTVSYSPLPLTVDADVLTAYLVTGLVTTSNTPGRIVQPAAAAVLRVLIDRGQVVPCPTTHIPCTVGTGTDDSCPLSFCCIRTSRPDSTHNPSWTVDTLTMLETNLDDITSEALAFAIQILMDNGAVDAWATPIVMKKGRPAHTLRCLSSNERVNQLLELMFRYTTTLGVRLHRNLERAALRRTCLTIKTPYGVDELGNKGQIVAVKVGYLNDEVVSLKPEFDHCKAIALHTGMTLQRVSDFVTAEAYKQLEETGSCGIAAPSMD